MNENSSSKSLELTLPLTTIGFVTWIVFLILKLCNQTNPDFEWLTWFWVWFPLWIPWALFVGIMGLILIAGVIYAFVFRGGEKR